MCGRIRLSPVVMPESLAAHSVDLLPGGQAVVLTSLPKTTSRIEYIRMRWGAETARSTHPLLHARLETVLERPMFAASYSARRGVILADGWWEQGRYVRGPNSHPIALAVIWMRLTTAHSASPAQKRFVLMTQSTVGSSLEAVHERAPVPVDSAHWFHNGAVRTLANEALVVVRQP